MKPVLLVLIIILASATLGYGFASAQMAGAGGGTPCTTSYPCAKVCGDHPCAPGEIYNSGGGPNGTAKIGKNGTAAPTMSTQMSISANVTATKIAKGTMNDTTTSKFVNDTTPVATQKTTTSQPSTLSPVKQFVLGIPPADIQCPSGYQLALNKFDQRPACVTAEVKAKLVERGWAVG